MRSKIARLVYNVYDGATDSVTCYDNLEDAIDEFINLVRVEAIRDKSILEEICVGDTTLKGLNKEELVTAVLNYGRDVHTRDNYFGIEEVNVYRKVR